MSVVGFFVLSGYLLQASFYRMGDTFDVERFFVGKAKNLLPAFLFSILISVSLPALQLIVLGLPFPLLSRNADIYSIFRYVWVYNIPAWYMGCIVVFLMMAPMIWCLHRRYMGVPLFFAGAFAFASFLYWRYDGTSRVLIGVLAGDMSSYPQVRLWEFLAGMIACRCGHALKISISSSVRRMLALCVCAALSALFIWVSVEYARGSGLPNCYWLTLILVLAFSMRALLWDDARSYSSVKFSRILAWLASLTYGVYLIHIPVYRWSAWGIDVLFHVELPRWLVSILVIPASMLLVHILNLVCARMWKKS